MKNIVKYLLCMALMLVLPVSVQAAKGYCMVCEGSYSYTEEYTEWTDEEHNIRHWCDNCGEDQYGGTLAEEHNIEHYSSRYDECTDCGYRIDCEHVCDHDITYTEWDDCDWYEYCVECDELVDEGTEHGDYEYDDWEYYSSSRHRRYYYCENCGGDDGYDYGYHEEETEYYEYDEDQHEVVEYCAECDSNISEDYEDHDFSYGSWTNYSGSQHRRSVYCYDCGYSGYEYENHSLTYGSWTSTGSSQHKRTISCSCGYSTTETASHNLTYGTWTNYSSTQHKRTVSCSTCSYSTTEYAAHSITTGNWTSISDTQHSRTGSCSCGYSGKETASHSFSYGEWESYSDSEHRRTVSCDCGYSGYAYEAHDHGTVAGVVPKDSKQHTITYACDCGHTVEEPEDHTFIYGEWESCNDAEHSREVSCDCGYSDEEYDDHTDEDSDGFCDICDAETSRFSVTVPAYLLMVLSQDGTVYAAASAEITNHSTAAVAVTDISFTTGSGWTLVPYTTDMANEKVDSRQIGFLLNGMDGYSGTLENDGRWVAGKNSSIPLTYDAVVSATSDILTEEQVLTIVFVLDWAV